MRLFVLLVLILVSACARKKQAAADSDHSADTTSLSVQTSGQKPITTDEMVGVWQESPDVGSGYLDHYKLMSDGSFRFVYNEMICDKRTIGYSGTWQILGDKLKLSIFTKSVIVGGKRVPTGDAGSCASDYYIEGGEKKDISFKDFQTITLSEIAVDTAKYDFNRVTFNGKRFWRVSDNP